MRIVLVGGGTLGSVSPLLAIAEALLDEHPQSDILFVGGKTGPERRMAEQANLQYAAIASGKLRRYFSLRTITAPFGVAMGYLQARTLLKKFRPDVVVSAGSYIAVPVVWAAHARNIPVLIHQQDIRPGLANKLTTRFATRITVTFPESVADFPQHKTVRIGNPVRNTVLHGDANRARERYHLQKHDRVVLVLGGSSGAQGLNDLVAAAAKKILTNAHIIQMTGKGQQTAAMTERHHCIPFLDAADIGDAYAVADIVVCRAGLATISELSALGKPTVLVPLSGTHQEDNAAYCAVHEAARVVREADGNGVFAETIHAMLEDDALRATLSRNMRALNPGNAAAHAVKILLEIAHV